MLVKIKPGVFVNPDHVITVVLLNDGRARVDTAGPGGAAVEPWTISREAVGYLLEVMETASAVTLPGEPDYIDPDAPSTQPLTSQIAILLRDTFPQGAMIDDLMTTLNIDYHLIYAALDSLILENVVKFGPDDISYFHAQHAPRDYTPEPERDLESIFVPINSDAFSTGLRNGDFQCVECEHQSCAACATANKCCQCSFPSFVLATPNPDPSVANEAPESNPAEDTEKKASHSTEY